jgi:hypothetical protein
MKPIRESKVVQMNCANIQQKQAEITCNSLSTYSKVLCEYHFFSHKFQELYICQNPANLKNIKQLEKAPGIPSMINYNHTVCSC